MNKLIRTTLLTSLTTLALCGGVVYASGSSGGGISTANNPQAVTETVKCQITAVNADGSVTMRDLETDKLSRMPVGEKVKITAEKKADFEGRKKLGFSDLSEGQTVKVTLHLADRQIVKIKVLKSA